MSSGAKLAGADVLRRQRRQSLPETLGGACGQRSGRFLVCSTALVLASTADCVHAGSKGATSWRLQRGKFTRTLCLSRRYTGTA